METVDFEAHYALHYASLLRYALHVTRDFFAAEEGVAQALIEDWVAGTVSSRASLVVRTRYRVLDLLRRRARVMGYVTIGDESIPPMSLERSAEVGVTVPLPYSRSAEDVALDVLTLKETLEQDGTRWDALLDTDLSTDGWHGTLTGYDHYGCRCAACKAVKSAYMRSRRPRPKRADTATHCVRGHEYVEGSYTFKPDGNKRCKLCRHVKDAA